MAYSTATASYQQLKDSGVLATEANCIQYCLDTGIVAPFRQCKTCQQYMALVSCASTKYKEEHYWRCCSNVASIRKDSILENSNLTFKQFIDILFSYSRGRTIMDTADSLAISDNAVRRIFKKLNACILHDLAKSPAKIGGPGSVVEVDESKFGKRKYNRGRVVDGHWILGGLERGTGQCFYEICPDNKRTEQVLLPIILKYVRQGTTVITDGWSAYHNLDAHGYVHFDVNHSQNFVDPATGAHTNSIEGSWFHVKKKLGRGGGRRTEDMITGQLYEFMWKRQKGITSSTKDNDRYFRTELPF